MPLSLSQVVRIAREICCGMAYLHANGILHCDLKSSNILLTESGQAKICDFGLATRFATSSNLSDDTPTSHIGETLQTSQIGETPQMLGRVGTHHWMAPEVLRGEGFRRASDVYSFGMLLWEVLVRRIPYQNMPVAHIIACAGYGRRRPPPSTPGTTYFSFVRTEDNRPNRQQTCQQTCQETQQQAQHADFEPVDLLKAVSADIPITVLRVLQACLQPSPWQRPAFGKLASELDSLYQSAVIDVEESLRVFFGQE